MRGKYLSGLIAVVIVTAWMSAMCSDAVAQGKGHGKSKEKKTAEQKEKGQGQGDKAQKNKGEKVKADNAQKQVQKQQEKAEKKAARFAYKPKHVDAKELAQWVDGNPPGWSQGEKVGWQGAGAPPGQMKKQGGDVAIYPPWAGDWDDDKKRDWDRKLERSKDHVRDTMTKRGGRTKDEEDSAIISIDRASRRGVPIDTVEETVNHAVEKGISGEDIEKVTRAMAYGADKNVDQEDIGKFARKEIDRGKTGDELALSVYEEIDRQHEAPKKKSPWWKRMFGG